MKDERLYLIHIQESLERIEDYLGGIDEAGFLESPIVQDAVIRNLQVMPNPASGFRKRARPARRRSTGAKWRGSVIL